MSKRGGIGFFAKTTEDMKPFLVKANKAEVKEVDTLVCASGRRVRLVTENSGWSTRESEIRLCVAPGQKMLTPATGLKATVAKSSTCPSIDDEPLYDGSYNAGYLVTFDNRESACLGKLDNKISNWYKLGDAFRSGP